MNMGVKCRCAVLKGFLPYLLYPQERQNSGTRIVMIYWRRLDQIEWPKMGHHSLQVVSMLYYYKKYIVQERQVW